MENSTRCPVHSVTRDPSFLQAHLGSVDTSQDAAQSRVPATSLSSYSRIIRASAGPGSPAGRRRRRGPRRPKAPPCGGQMGRRQTGRGRTESAAAHGDPGWPSVAGGPSHGRVASGVGGAEDHYRRSPDGAREDARSPSRFRRKRAAWEGRRGLRERASSERSTTRARLVRAAASALTAASLALFQEDDGKSPAPRRGFRRPPRRSEKSHRFRGVGERGDVARDEWASGPSRRRGAARAPRRAPPPRTPRRVGVLRKGRAGGLGPGEVLPHLMASPMEARRKGPRKERASPLRRPTRSARGWRPAARSMPSGNSSGRDRPGRTAAPCSAAKPLPPGGAGMRTERVLDDHSSISA